MNADVRGNVHKCQADGCDERIPSRLFMCRRHWYMVPSLTRRRLRTAYTSKAWRQYDRAAEDAVAAVRERETRT